MLENKLVKGVHSSRYIASWVRSGGRLSKLEGTDDFDGWLKSLGISDKEIDDIRELATCGRLELESSAKNYLAKK